MMETIHLLTGYSFLNPEVIITQKAVQIGTYKDPEGNELGPEYDGLTESWLNRNDMYCTIFTVKKEEVMSATSAYQTYVKVSTNPSSSDEEIVHAKEAFLQYMQ